MPEQRALLVIVVTIACLLVTCCGLPSRSRLRSRSTSRSITRSRSRSSSSFYIRDTTRGINGGANCAACTVVLALVEQTMELHNITVVTALDILCSYLPPTMEPACLTLIEFLGPLMIKLVVHNNGPDVVCHALKFCYTAPGRPTCRTVTPPRIRYESLSFEEKVLEAKRHIHHLVDKYSSSLTGSICDLPGLKEICDWINKIFSSHEPLIDNDGDHYSIMLGLRGTSWRGKDCDDNSKTVHPGAMPHNQDRVFDSNCNGIYGVNNKTRRGYEEELCGSSKPRGIAVLGDSVSAHFRLPPQWLDATLISKKAFRHLDLIIENQLDWPMMSTATGHGSDYWKEVITGPIDSLYKRLWERNRCNHRDYQNIAVNGEDSFEMVELVKTLARDHRKDQPLIVIHALVGNDVCNADVNSLAEMTTPREMYHNTMKTLKYLDEHLPANSHVILVGLVDGRILFDNMADRIHPVLTYWGGFTYSMFYDYLNCLEISPCSGWLTSNATMRNLTTQRATELTDVLQRIHIKHKGHFQNFDLHFLDNPFPAVMDLWKRMGGEGWQLIEPSDGFHANQMAQALAAKVIWEQIWWFPDILGPENPNNDIIKKLFKDQGGY